MKTFLAPLFAVAVIENAGAAIFLVDTFNDERDFSISESTRNVRTPLIGNRFGGVRNTAINRDIIPEGTMVSSTLDSNAGMLSASFDGPSSDPSRPLEFDFSYFGKTSNLLGADAFEFDFSALSGTGSLIVELGNQSDVYGSEANRVSLSQAGTLTLPFDELNFGDDGASVDSFDELHFTFEAESEQFSFTLDEIRAVPEPSSFFLAALAGVFGLTRRSRQPSEGNASVCHLR